MTTITVAFSLIALVLVLLKIYKTGADLTDVAVLLVAIALALPAILQLP